MSNIINRLDSLLTKNGGTGSGWWNPDHAARMALDRGTGYYLRGNLAFDEGGGDTLPDTGLGKTVKNAASSVWTEYALFSAYNKSNPKKKISHIDEDSWEDFKSDQKDFDGLNVSFSKMTKEQSDLLGATLNEARFTSNMMLKLNKGVRRSPKRNLGKDIRREAAYTLNHEVKYLSQKNKEAKTALKDVKIIDKNGKEVPVTKALTNIEKSFTDYLQNMDTIYDRFGS